MNALLRIILEIDLLRFCSSCQSRRLPARSTCFQHVTFTGILFTIS